MICVHKYIWMWVKIWILEGGMGKVADFGLLLACVPVLMSSKPSYVCIWAARLPEAL